MGVYFESLKVGLKEQLAFPIDFLSYIIRKMIALGFLLLFWYIIASSNQETFDVNKTLSYFLISQAVVSLTFYAGARFGRDVQKYIRWGNFSNVLVKPVDSIHFQFAFYVGQRIPELIYAVITLMVGIYLFPPLNIWGIILFPFSLLITTLLSVGMGTYLAMLAFYTPESGSIKNAYTHVRRLFSGSLIPLIYFPDLLRKIIELTPFPVMVYYPTVILQEGTLNQDTFIKLGLSIFWALLIYFSSRLVWKKALKNYDGVGI